jgi:hypothetical protein
MPSQPNSFTVVFPEWFDARVEHETPSKGWLTGVEVRLEDGSRYELSFIDPARLQQTLADDEEAGRPYYAEPGLVVLPRVDREAVRVAVAGLVEDGYFRRLKPSAKEAPARR